MNTTKTSSLMFRSILSILLLTFLMIDARATTTSASELTILYSNDIRGETEPCG